MEFLKKCAKGRWTVERSVNRLLVKFTRT